MDSENAPNETLLKKLPLYAYPGKPTSSSSSTRTKRRTVPPTSVTPPQRDSNGGLASISQVEFDLNSAKSQPAALETTRTEDKDRIRKRRSKEDDDTAGESSRAPSPKKRKRGYAYPSTYGHLRELNDYLKPGLDIVFCGINPGKVSATLGHHFANPTNHFWSCLHESGLIPSRMKPQEDFSLPDLHNLGLTNLVGRPTAEAAELSKSEMEAGVPEFLAKIQKSKPKIVCFVGLAIASMVHSYVTKHLLEPPKRGKGDPKTRPGVGLLQFKLTYSGSETLFYAVSSTSGRVVKYQKSDKIAQFQALNDVRVGVKESTYDSSSLASISWGEEVEAEEGGSAFS